MNLIEYCIIKDQHERLDKKLADMVWIIEGVLTILNNERRIAKEELQYAWENLPEEQKRNLKGPF